MSQQEFLSRIIKKNEEARIPYMIAGSIGSSFHGEPRATNDIDIVISPTPDKIKFFIQSLKSDYYIDDKVAEEALRSQSVFNIIDHKTGWKTDLLIIKDRKFSQEEFKRRQIYEVAGMKIFLVTPEDAILSKLEWSKDTESERQYRDALGVAIVQWENLDKEYLRTWAKELKIIDILENLFKQVEDLQSPNNRLTS